MFFFYSVQLFILFKVLFLCSWLLLLGSIFWNVQIFCFYFCDVTGSWNYSRRFSIHLYIFNYFLCIKCIMCIYVYCVHYVYILYSLAWILFIHILIKYFRIRSLTRVPFSIFHSLIFVFFLLMNFRLYNVFLPIRGGCVGWSGRLKSSLIMAAHARASRSRFGGWLFALSLPCLQSPWRLRTEQGNWPRNAELVTFINICGSVRFIRFWGLCLSCLRACWWLFFYYHFIIFF